jgi:hypothetical protein
MFKSGTFTNVPLPTAFAHVSRKAAQQAKRAMAEGWSHTSVNSGSADPISHRYAAAKVSRGQLGEEIHALWIKDLIKHCGTKVLLICDLAHGSAEIQKAVVDAKVSAEASSAGVRVCSFAQDPRRVFAELGQARVLTRLGEFYLSGKLSLPGHTPVPNPGDEPGRTRKMIKALLPTPLRALTLNSVGELLIPDEKSLARACPVALSGKSLAQLATWRAEFNTAHGAQAAAPEVMPANGGTPAEEPANGGTPAGEPANGGTTDASEVTADTRTNKLEDVGDTILQSAAISSTVSAHKVIRVVLTRTRSGSRRVWMHNTSQTDVSLPSGTFFGHGGPGTFISLVQQALEPSKEKCAWRWTRISTHKRDSPELGGAMIFQRGTSGEPDGTVPILSTLDAIEKELGNNVTLYAHSITRGSTPFTATKVTVVPAVTPVVWCPHQTDLADGKFCSGVLGQYIPSREIAHGTSQTKSTGLVRAVFAVEATERTGSGSSGIPGIAWSLQPKCTPNSVHFFLVKKLDIKAGEFVAF